MNFYIGHDNQSRFFAGAVYVWYLSSFFSHQTDNSENRTTGHRMYCLALPSEKADSNVGLRTPVMLS